MEKSVRPPAVAGTFYGGDATRLRATVGQMIRSADLHEPAVSPRMLIVPHAGHIYSGPVAAAAFRLLAEQAPNRIGLVGPSHFIGFGGLAAPAHDALATPLGTIPVDPEIDTWVAGGRMQRSELAHQREHSLEVQLPFLQVVLEDFSVAPVLTGDEDPGPSAEIIGLMLDAGLTVIVSSDLSHYHDHETARRLDAVTAGAIVELRHADLDRDSACGRTAVRGALRVAEERGWKCELLDLKTSGDTAGGYDRVVGYGAFVLGPG
jgi:hypothetical protein